MRELVRQQALPRDALRRILAGPEHDIAAYGIGAGVDGVRRLGGPVIDVNAHLAEVLAEPCFQVAAGCGGERLPRRRQHVMDNPGHRPGWTRAGRDTRERDALLRLMVHVATARGARRGPAALEECVATGGA